MPDLRTQLHEYGTQLDEEATPLPDLLPGARLVALSAGPRRRGWAIALASAAVVITLIGGWVWLLGTLESPNPPADQPAPTYGSLDPSVVTQSAFSAPSDLGSGWVMLDVESGGHLAAATDRGVVVLSLTEQGPDGKGFATWYSSDAITWLPAGGIDQRPDLYSIDVAAGGPGFVAVGNDLASSTGRIWISSDGLLWDAVFDTSPSQGGCASMAQVEANREAVVVLGCDGTGTLTAWHSSDGRTWTPTGFPGTSAPFAGISAGDLGFVLFGPPELMFSPDGQVWSPIATDRLPPGGLAVSAVGSLLIGYQQTDGMATVWSSADMGVTWRESAVRIDRGLPAGEPLDLHEIVSSPFGYVGVGMVGEMDEEFEEDPEAARAFIVHSWDGVDWVAFELEDAPPFSGIVATDDAIYGSFGGNHWMWARP